MIYQIIRWSLLDPEVTSFPLLNALKELYRAQPLNISLPLAPAREERLPLLYFCSKCCRSGSTEVKSTVTLSVFWKQLCLYKKITKVLVCHFPFGPEASFRMEAVQDKSIYKTRWAAEQGPKQKTRTNAQILTCSIFTAFSSLFQQTKAKYSKFFTPARGSSSYPSILSFATRAPFWTWPSTPKRYMRNNVWPSCILAFSHK